MPSKTSTGVTTSDDASSLAGSDRAGIPSSDIDFVFRWSRVLTSDQYVEGFGRIANRTSELQRRILAAQYYAPEHTAYATQLARVACVSGGHPVVNAQYGRLGHLFMDAMGYKPDVRRNATPRWWSAFSKGHHTRHGFVWELLPEVAEALERIGWVAPGGLTLAEEVVLPDGLREGSGLTLVVNAYERNPVARSLCIAHYGTACAVCGFDFFAVYGPVADGFVHVHHLIPISQVGHEYIVDPIEDLRPVCANCHAVIHLGGACRTIEEVRAMIKQGKGE